MSSNLPVTIGGTEPATKDPLDRAADYAAAEKSDATRRAYRSDFEHFKLWCCGDHTRRTPLPASIETAAAYLAHLADSGLKASTITRRCAAITYAHRLAGAPPPTTAEPVKAVLRGIRRRIGVAVTRKAPATARAISGMLKRIPDTLAGKRDRALLLIGFSAALRRSELVALDIADVETVPDGIVIHVRRSKTDQEGEGHEIAIPRGSRLKPVEAIEAWITTLTTSLTCAECLTTGEVNSAGKPQSPTAHPDHGGSAAAYSAEFAKALPLFVSIRKGGRPESKRLSDRAVALIVKRWAGAARLDPATFAGHSLRAGFVTSALEKGADPFKIMDVTRHKRVDTLRIYDRRAKAFKNHAGKDFL
jgi:site-specific recombinase XerD